MDIFRRDTIVTPSSRRDASVVVNVILETLSFNCSLFLLFVERVFKESIGVHLFCLHFLEKRNFQ